MSLFLSHYQRNLYHKTVSSQLSGSLRCGKASPPDIPTGAPTGPPLVNCSTASITFNSTFNASCSVGGDDWDGSFTTNDFPCCVDSALSCHSFVSACYLLDGEAPSPPPNCELTIDRCPEASTCPASLNLEIVGGLTKHFFESQCQLKNCTLIIYACADIRTS